jgi:HAD superfamily phosphatase
VISADDVVNGKPAPDGLLEIAAATGERRMWYVGDTVDDARSAKAARVPFIGIASAATPRRAELESLFAAEGAVRVLEDINQLEGVI